MSEPYVGETRIFAFGFVPAGWMACQGQLVPVAELPGLFKIIGTKYGGDGETNFGLPNVAPLQSDDGGQLSVCISLFGAAPTGG
jgi:microcystin-dependent protein